MFLRKGIFYGLRGSLLKSISIVSITPLVISMILLYLFTRNSIISTSDQTIQNAVNNIREMSTIQSAYIDSQLLKEIDRSFKIATAELKPYSNRRLSKQKNTIEILNQATGNKEKIELPILLTRKGPFHKNYKLVDTVAKKINIEGATATIFQFYENKMIRIATNVKKGSGERAVHSYIPEESIVFRTIKQNKPYKGRAIVVGKWCVTHYEPLKDRNGNLVGAFYIGVPAPDTGLFKMIENTKIGEKGYISITNSEGQIIHHPFLPKGSSLSDLKDPISGKFFAREIYETKEGALDYHYKDSENNIEKRRTRFTYFKKWDWIIMANISYDDILGTLNTIFEILIILLIIFPVALLFISNYLALRISRPLRKIIETAVKVSAGDLTVFIPQKHYKKCVEIKKCDKTECPAYSSSNLACWAIENTHCEENIPADCDNKIEQYCKNCKVYNNAIRSETDELIEAINNMIITTQHFVSDLKITTDELKTRAVELADVSQKMEEESQTQASFIEETTSANEELMATIESVADSAENQAVRVAQTSAAMEELTASTKNVGENSANVSTTAKGTVEEARNTESMLKDTTKSINQVAENSQKIGNIIGIINDISDQINLLSLNAAIEAARAGDHGKGFAVVSEEISKLAEATAQSTKEIEDVVKTIRFDIQTGAGLVNQTNDAITQMVEKIDMAAKLIEEIAMSSVEQSRGSEQVMSDVEEVNRMSEQIANATNEQKTTSSEILKALTRINDSIQEIAGSSSIVSESAETLKEKSRRLDEISQRFKTKQLNS